jgi:hypothetical protein
MNDKQNNDSHIAVYVRVRPKLLEEDYKEESVTIDAEVGQSQEKTGHHHVHHQVTHNTVQPYIQPIYYTSKCIHAHQW